MFPQNWPAGNHSNVCQGNISAFRGTRLTRRAAMKTIAASAGVAALSNEVRTAEAENQSDPRKRSPKRYDMKKSINQWAFPYPHLMNLEECLQLAKDAGFDAIELNYDLDNDLSPKSNTEDYHRIRRLASKIDIQISGLCSFLFWPYPLTSNDPAKRAKGIELAGNIARASSMPLARFAGSLLRHRTGREHRSCRS